jgi:hypothetical protein
METADSFSWLPMYDPPYDSPLEDSFAWALTKYLRPGTNLEKQVEVRTICGVFYLDFVATTTTGRRVAYECDGGEFHEAQRDEWRDAMILGANAVDTIIRLRGSDLTYHLEDVLWLLANWDPDVFSTRSQHILFRLASERARNHRHDCVGSAMITYWEESTSPINPLHVFLVHRNHDVPPGQREFWQTAFRFANSVGGGSLDTVLARWRAVSKG